MMQGCWAIQWGEARDSSLKELGWWNSLGLRTDRSTFHPQEHHKCAVQPIN